MSQAKPLGDTVFTKEQSGWTAKSEYLLLTDDGANPDAGDRQRILTIRTYKDRANLVTRASVGHLEGGFVVQHLAFGSERSGDFYHRWDVIPVTRVTEQLLRQHHAKALGTLNLIVQVIDQHYALQQEAQHA